MRKKLQNSLQVILEGGGYQKIKVSCLQESEFESIFLCFHLHKTQPGSVKLVRDLDLVLGLTHTLVSLTVRTTNNLSF